MFLTVVVVESRKRQRVCESFFLFPTKPYMLANLTVKSFLCIVANSFRALLSLNSSSQRRKMETTTLNTSKTKITDLNDDCLQHIFNHLNLIDLIKIVGIHDRFSFAASNSFYSKYKNKWIDDIDDVDHQQLLRFFGNEVTNLKISGRKNDSIGINIDYIIEYLRFARTFEMIPLKKIKEIEFNGIFESTCVMTEYVCARVQSLHFVNASMDPNIIGRNFPSLKTLTIRNYVWESVQPKFLFTNVILESALSLNTQLLSLSLCHGRYGIGIDVTANLLQFIARTCPFLQNLEIEFLSDKFYCFNGADEVAIFEQLKKCTLSVFNGGMLTKIPVQFPGIEMLTLDIKTTASKDIIHFILKNYSLRKLQIKFCSSVEDYLIDYSDMIILTTLPRIESIFIRLPIAISGHNIIQFVLRCKTVQEVCLIFIRSGKMIMLQNGLPISIDNGKIDLLNVEREINILRNSKVNSEWNLKTSINYVHNNSQNDIDAVEILFRRKKK